MDDAMLINVIEATPLVSIDLIVRNPRAEVLLGLRNNRPARGYWFVPGGRIRKNERIHSALQRIAAAEIGWTPDPAVTRFAGVYEHLYPDNYLERPGIGTHYVVLAYEIDVGTDIPLAADDQHTALRWWTPDRLLASARVHANTQAYFV